MTTGMSIRTASMCQIRGKDVTKFTLLKERPPKKTLYGVRREIGKSSIDSQTKIRYGPKVWTKIGTDRSESRRNKNGRNEMPKLDNARRLRGIYFIDPDEQDYKETLKKN